MVLSYLDFAPQLDPQLKEDFKYNHLFHLLVIKFNYHQKNDMKRNINNNKTKLIAILVMAEKCICVSAWVCVHVCVQIGYV